MTNIASPNFFIVGAPKCGTTSLAVWLSEHPNIYMSPVKEPHFFNTDLKHIHTPTNSEYRRLFNRVRPHHIAIGEASVYYLYSRVAVPRIEEEIGGPKYIVMIRNPIDMAYSHHEQQVFSGNEHVADFREAWALQNDRRAGRSVSRWCREPSLLLYGDVCRLGDQLRRMLDVVPMERVHIIVLDDVKTDARTEYVKVLNFLGVPDDGRKNFLVSNSAKVRRCMALRHAVYALSRTRRYVRLPRLGGISFYTLMDRFNRRTRPRKPMESDMRRRLCEYFAEDVVELGAILGRDLTPWLSQTAMHNAEIS